MDLIHNVFFLSLSLKGGTPPLTSLLPSLHEQSNCEINRWNTNTSSLTTGSFTEPPSKMRENSEASRQGQTCTGIKGHNNAVTTQPVSDFNTSSEFPIAEEFSLIDMASF